MNSDKNIYARIEERYKFEIPKAYRDMRMRGWFDVPPRPTSLKELISSGKFLWIPDCEMLSLQEILDFEFYIEPASNFVPFAHASNGDHFAWYPDKTNSQGDTHIVDLPHDCDCGHFIAPNFVSGIYHQILSHCGGISNCENQSFEEVEQETRTQIGLWCEQLAEFFPQDWLQQLKELQKAPIIKTSPTYGMLLDHGKLKSIYQRDLNYPQIASDREFVWMKE